MNNSEIEAEIRAMLKCWDEALYNKDLDALSQEYSDNFVCYDIAEHAHGADGYKKLWEPCMEWFGDHITVERKDVVIHAEETMALVHCLTRLSGMKETTGADMEKSWIRATVVFRKIEGQWKVVHEHASFPIDCMAEKPKYILDEAEAA